MLTLSRRQLSQLEVSAEQQLQSHVLSYILTHHADAVVRGSSLALAVLPANTLFAMVVASLSRARSFGLTWASNLTAYVVLRVLVDPYFDEAPHVARCFAVPAAADLRFDEVLQAFDDDDWQAVRQHRHT